MRLWNVDSGACAQTVKQQPNTVSSGAWLPDSRRFVLGTVDRCCRATPLIWLDGTPVNAQAGSRVNVKAITLNLQCDYHRLPTFSV